MMAGGGAYFGGELPAWTAGSYSASSGHGGGGQYFVHNDDGAPPAGAAAVPDAGSGIYGAIGGMDRHANFAGYGSGGGAPMAMAAPARPPPRARAQGALSRAPWTEEEDEALMEAVRQHGNELRKWAAISLHLPGRTGKQCRERWVNHVNPDIKNKMWTEEEDMELIAAHQSCGNRWSAIARKLSGRSENSVKNHWNATRRSLKAKRTLKKRNCEQPPPGQPSVLAEYIRNLYPATEWPPAELPAVPGPPTEPDYQNQQVGSDTTLAAAPLAYAAPPMDGMYWANMQHSGAPDMNAAAGYPYYTPPYPQVNYQLPYVPPPTPAQMISSQDLHAAAAYVDSMYPFADEQRNLQADQARMDRPSSANNLMGNAGDGADGWCYFGTNGSAGPSRSGSVDVVQMASREFEVRDEDMVTLDHLTRSN